MNGQHQFVDEWVTRQKFEAELARFAAAEDVYRSNGVLLLKNSYPNLFFGFASPHLTPRVIVFGVRINFSNYDVLPPSVQFVDPLSLEPVGAEQLRTRLHRKIATNVLTQDNGVKVMNVSVQPLVMTPAVGLPFLCIPGVREYHEHPRHRDSSWLRLRGGQEGRLCFLLDNLVHYGTDPVRVFSTKMPAQDQSGQLQILDMPIDNLGVGPLAQLIPS